MADSVWNKIDEDFYGERFELMAERIRAIPAEDTLPEKYRAYVRWAAPFLLKTIDIFEKKRSGALGGRTLAECQADQDALYKHILPENYQASFANPAYAVSVFGEEMGQMLSFLTSELEGCIAWAYQGRIRELTILLELFVQIYTLLEEDDLQDCPEMYAHKKDSPQYDNFTPKSDNVIPQQPSKSGKKDNKMGMNVCEGKNSDSLLREKNVSADLLREVHDVIYWHFHDYSEIFVENQIHDMICPDDNFFVDIIRNADLTDLRYLYSYGLPVGKNELETAAFLNRMSDEQIRSMADTYTEGYRIGFAMTGKDLSKKKTAEIHYCIGFERMMRAAVKNFEAMGLKVTIAREAVSSFNGKGVGKRGAYSTSVNRQYDFDHREDRALYFDKAFVERRLEVMRTVFGQHSREAAGYAGPAVLEVFGETPFSPETKPEALHYDEKQQELNVYFSSENTQIVYKYIHGEERSFTIIAYPVPEIGERFADIFAETVVINTLDYKKYQTMQQSIIDVLDQAKTVHIRGTNGNRTDLTVTIYPLADPEKETAFENCVADVNIPVGEVFTSPVLAGTNGTLHVSEVFLNGLQFQNLELTFMDGMVTDYACTNFADEADNRKYIKDNVLMHHDTLPMGEFAIGTNTTAYVMAEKYNIADKLPILIAEKTGPHFAVGDTCYSFEEDLTTYNPDGKRIVARENEVSALRKEDPAKAYFNCHTDITIPYEELGAITVIRADGTKTDIIRDGRFRVRGAEELNEPLARMK